MWEQKLKIYDELVSQCPRFDRKGKTMPYTSANGHMFSMLNKAAELGIRFSEETQKNYLKKFQTTHYVSHVILKGYILITDAMLEDQQQVVKLLDESYDFVMSLKPK